MSMGKSIPISCFFGKAVSFWHVCRKKVIVIVYKPLRALQKDHLRCLSSDREDPKTEPPILDPNTPMVYIIEP